MMKFNPPEEYGAGAPLGMGCTARNSAGALIFSQIGCPNNRANCNPQDDDNDPNKMLLEWLRSAQKGKEV